MQMEKLSTAMAIRVLGALAAISLLSPAAYSQSDTAQISGYVRDSSLAVVPGVSVTVVNESTGMERRTQTNASGFYAVSNLPPGYYTLAVEAPGFKRFVKTRNKLDANLATTIEATLELGAVTETIEVVADVGAVQSETATVGKVIENTQIQNMTLNGRNPVLLALLKAGVTRSTSLADFTFAMNSGGYAINGSRSQDNLITNDGAVAVRTRANGTSIGAVDVDTVQEIQILTANYNAEYGRSNGGQIRIITKSGGKDFHGTAYEFLRNDKLDANSFNRNRADLDREQIRFNQFGYNVNGPVYIPGKWNSGKDKLFFLWGQEWVRFRQQQTSIVTVPSLSMRQGDFSELLNPANTFFDGARQLTDPETGAPFENNVIPAARLSSNGVGLLNAFPEPTPGFQQGRNNFIQTRPAPQNQRKDTLSVDFNPVENHMFRFRFQNYNLVTNDGFRGGTDRAPSTLDRPNKTGSINYIWTVSPNTVNEVLVTASVDRVFINVQPDAPFQRSRFGIDFPNIFPTERKEIPDKIPTIDVNNFVTVDGGPYPSSSTGPIYQIANNLTHIMGNHTLKFGAAFDRQGQNDFDQINVTGVPGGTNNQNGRFVFTDDRPGGSGLAIGNTALGLFSTFAEIGDRAFTPYRANAFSWFAQDSWRVNSRLKIEIGIRHDLIQPYYFSEWRNISVFRTDAFDPAQAVQLDPATGNIIPGSGDPLNGVVIPGTGFNEAARGRVPGADTGEFDRLFSGGKKTPAEFHGLNFSPRVGIAYQVDAKTVLRGGFGRFFARPGVSDNIFLGGNAPFQPQVSVSNGLVDNPGGAGQTQFPLFFTTIDPVFRIPSSYNWNATLEREVGFNTTVTVAYVGRVGQNLERVRELNALQPGTRTDPANAGLNTNFLRPFSGFSFINLGENAARSEYNGLQLSADRRFSNGLGFGVAYTFSESKDNASGRRDQIYNPFDDSIFWGPSSFDSRHVAVINFIYEVPFFKNASTLSGKLLGGWQVSSVIQFQTGTPFTVGRNEDNAGIGSGNQFQPFERNGEVELSRSDRAFSEGASDSNFFFQTANPDGSPIFTRSAPGTFSTTQTRNEFNNPGFQNWNLGLFKSFRIDERQNVQFRAEFINAANHPNFSNPDIDPTSSTFGKVTGKTSQRQVQLSLRYSF